MLVVALFTVLFTAEAVSSGLTMAEIAQFKPLDPDRIEQNTGLMGEVSITGMESDASYLTVYTNGVPSHDNYKWPRADEIRPIKLRASKTAFNIPKEPKLRDEPIFCIPFGVVGVATGGVLIYDAYTPRKYCPLAFLVEAFDMCAGHPDPGGAYHYHSHSTCNSMDVCGEPSSIFGVALDGIPIYGPYDEQGKQLVQEDLDICGGRVDSEGRYKYHITADPPYLLNCFRGEIHKDLWDTEHPNLDTFDCTCPFDDSSFPECYEDKWCEDDTDSTDARVRAAAERAYMMRLSTMPLKPKTCDWDNPSGEFAACIDKANTSYTPSFKQVKQRSTMDLIACCPQGADCGSSCTNNAACYVEQREGMFMVNRILGSEGESVEPGYKDWTSGAGQGCQVVMILTMLLWSMF